MKNFFASCLLLLATAGALSSCRDTSKLPEPANESIPLIIPAVNPQKSFFSFTESRASVNTAVTSNYVRPVFEFVVNPSSGYAELQTVEVYKSYRRGTTFGPRVKVTDLTSFPATISINSQDAITGLYLNSPTVATPAPLPIKALTDAAINRIANSGDAVVFTFEYVMKDGRRIILTPLNTTKDSGSEGAVIASSLVNAPLAAVAEFRLK